MNTPNTNNTEDIKIGTKGYIPCWPFIVEYTGDLGTGWESRMGVVTEFYWSNFIAPFWDGTVKIKKGKKFEGRG